MLHLCVFFCENANVAFFSVTPADTLTSRNNLASTYRFAGRLEQAINLFEQNLTDSEHVLGPNHPWTTLFRDNLARAREARN